MARIKPFANKVYWWARPAAGKVEGEATAETLQAAIDQAVEQIEAAAPTGAALVYSVDANGIKTEDHWRREGYR